MSGQGEGAGEGAEGGSRGGAWYDSPAKKKALVLNSICFLHSERRKDAISAQNGNRGVA